MILSNKKKVKIAKDRNMVFVGLLVVILAGLLVVSTGRKKEAKQPEGVFCDAETVEGNYFVSNGFKFEGGAMQSDRRSRSGKYSCKLTPQNRFGLVYKSTNFIKGGKYKASVWRYTESTKGFLRVEGNTGSGFKIEERVAVKEKDGFEKLQIIFKVPDNVDTLKIYPGVEVESGAVYFDDLQLQLLQTSTAAKDFKPDLLNLEIAKSDLTRLSDQKWKAVKEGILFSGDEDRVSGKMISKNEGQEIPVKMRLKGDWTDHLKGDKWSFRIKTGGESSWNRMRTFSIQNPTTRGFLKEWVFHKLLEKEDILSPKYDFIQVKLNEKDLGIYAFEEHFDKHLPESQERREGPILKLTEDLFWLGMKRKFALNQNSGIYNNAENAFEGSDIRAFKESKLQLSPTLSAQFKTAQTLLHQFKYQLKPVNEIFDVERLAKYFAIMDVLGAYHGNFWHNLRFYFNPISSRLEPIGFDGFGDQDTHLKGRIVLGYKADTEDIGENLTKSLFANEAFFKAYMKQLNRFSEVSYLQDFFTDISTDIAVREQYLQKEFEGYHFFKNPFIERARTIHLLIAAYTNESIIVRTQEKKDGNTLLKVSNTHAFPVEIIGYGEKNGAPEHLLPQPVFVFSNPPHSIPKYSDLTVPDRAKFLFFQVAGVDSVYSAEIVNWPIAGEITQRQMMFADTLKSNDIFEISDNKVLFKKGNHTAIKDICIPDNYKVYFEPGTRLDLQKNAAFISRSPVYILGTEELPVEIISSDGTGNGFSVLQAEGVSRVSYCNFKNLNTLNKGDWILTGAVTFFEADVEIANASFIGNNCEDGLNIVHSTFTLDHSLIADTFSDGFDADFCEGNINNSIFRETGNDGMDFSGSVITVDNVEVYNAGDKGLSVGEFAQVHLKKAKMIGANTGVASKDLSTLTIDDIYLEDCIKGFTAYQKKPEYGKANIVVKKYVANDIKHLFLLDKGSVLDLMGQLHTGEL